MSCNISWPDISFPPVNLWVVTDVSYFYAKENEMGKMKAMAIDMQEMNDLINFLEGFGDEYVEGCCECTGCSQEQPEQLELPFGDGTSAWE